MNFTAPRAGKLSEAVLRFALIALLTLTLSRCFTHLPILDKQAEETYREGSQWVENQPMAEVYSPEDEFTLVPPLPSERGATVFRLAPEKQTSTSIRFARNYAVAELTLGKTLTMQFSGKGEGVVTDAVFREIFFEKANFMGEMMTEILFEFPLSAFGKRIPGTEKKHERMALHIPLLGTIQAEKRYMEPGFFLRHVQNESVVGYNHPLFPNFSRAPVSPGSRWEIVGRYEKKFEILAPRSPYTLTKAQVVGLQNYLFKGITLWKGRRCAVIEIHTEEYEMQDIGSTWEQNDGEPPKTLPKNLLESTPREIREYFRGRGGGFQVSSKSDGYFFLDLAAKTVLLHRFERRAFSAGGTNLVTGGAAENYGKGVLRERWRYAANGL